MLFIIGTGLTTDNISLRSLEILKKCKIVYLEGYTSMMDATLIGMETCYNCQIIPVCRMFIENTDIIIHDAKTTDIALLVIGTPFFATTHSEILVRAKKQSVDVEIIHNSGIQNVMGIGFFSYNFGKTVSIPFFTERWKPVSVMDKIIDNHKNGYHSLCLLDIQVNKCSNNKNYTQDKHNYIVNQNYTVNHNYSVNQDNQDNQNNQNNQNNQDNQDNHNISVTHEGVNSNCQCQLLRKSIIEKSTKVDILAQLKDKYDSLRYMTADIAIQQLLEIDKISGVNLITLETEIAVICRFGAKNQKLYFGKIKKLLETDFGAPLHALIIPGRFEIVERENVFELFEIV
ncbi:Diphthine methyl ester synthase [Dictyocoela muelleri]|nr:Diphthine methyl ester synthase [Dictyocoela muelleri]